MSQSGEEELAAAANVAAAALKEQQLQVVFAESCTAGLAAATLATVPGISDFHCGSAVTYRNDTKHCWLGVREEDLERHTAVSDVVARQMAQGVLARTPEAEIAVSVTGHLGPNAPDGFDGLVFIGAARRRNDVVEVLEAERIVLKETARRQRQMEAATRVLRRLSEIARSIPQ